MFKGPCSDSTKRKMSEAQKGRHHSEETKRKIAKALTGNKNTLGYKHTEEMKRKLSKAYGGPKNPFWGKYHSEEARQRMSESHKGQVPWIKGRTFSAESRRKLSESHKGKSHSVSEETRKKISKAKQGVPLSEMHVRNIMVACGKKPTKPEIKLGNLLDNILPGEYRYVGDGQFILGGKCPDFVNVNGKKKIIELFGDYWHKGENPQDRINVFKPFGFETIVVWEHELKDEKGLTARLLTSTDLITSR